ARGVFTARAGHDAVAACRRPPSRRWRAVAISTVAGEPYHQNTVTYQWRCTRRRAAVTGVRLHDLRHFYASGLIAADRDVVTVSRTRAWVEHDSLTTYTIRGQRPKTAPGKPRPGSWQTLCGPRTLRGPQTAAGGSGAGQVVLPCRFSSSTGSSTSPVPVSAGRRPCLRSPRPACRPGGWSPR